MRDFIYGGFTQAELDAQYDTSVPVEGGVQPYFERFAAEAERARVEISHEADLRYGGHERETMDFFRAGDGAPLLVWVHGGYWRRFSKDAVTFVVRPFVAAGIAVALVNYPLAPEVGLGRIVASVREAHRFAVRHAVADGGMPPRRIVAGGHSVGAQLAAMIAPVAPLDGIIGLSGLYDLEPIRLSNINETIGMDVETALRYSPIAIPPLRASRLLLAAGEREQGEFHRQLRAYAATWRGWGGDVDEVALPGGDHFSIVLSFADPATVLARAAVALVLGD